MNLNLVLLLLIVVFSISTIASYAIACNTPHYIEHHKKIWRTFYICASVFFVSGIIAVGLWS